jgi:steroid delta-isomerase-like uncharacterized protein
LLITALLSSLENFRHLATRESSSENYHLEVKMAKAAPRTSVRQTRETTVKEHIDAENRHDPAATVATFSDHKASYDIPAFGEAGQVPDHNAIRELFEGMFSVFPDFHIEAGALQHGDDHVFVEIRLSGTQHADWAGIPSTGKSFSTRMAVLYEFEEDQLVCERVYMDFADIARQLGSNS